MYANEEKYERWRQTLLLRALDKKGIQTTSSKGKKKTSENKSTRKTTY